MVTVVWRRTRGWGWEALVRGLWMCSRDAVREGGGGGGGRGGGGDGEERFGGGWRERGGRNRGAGAEASVE